MSNSLRPHGLQHTRLSCPSPTPGVAQTHVHRVSDAIQPSHPLSSPSPHALPSYSGQGIFLVFKFSERHELTSHSLPLIVYIFILSPFMSCWRRLLRVPWTARRPKQSILKEISPGCSLEGLMLKLKLQYFGHLMRRADSLEKTLMLGGIRSRRRRG